MTSYQTERGFPGYLEMIDLYGSRIRVQMSSRAFHPAVWVFTERVRGCQLTSDGHAHLTLPQARLVRDALNAFITEAEDLIARELYWEEPDEF